MSDTRKPGLAIEDILRQREEMKEAMLGLPEPVRVEVSMSTGYCDLRVEFLEGFPLLRIENSTSRVAAQFRDYADFRAWVERLLRTLNGEPPAETFAPST